MADKISKKEAKAAKKAAEEVAPVSEETNPIVLTEETPETETPETETPETETPETETPETETPETETLISTDAWAVTLNIWNNTRYYIDVVNNVVGKVGVIAPNAFFTWNTSDPNNADALCFWITPDVYYMQGGVNFGPEAGVYVDRGWMAENDQSIVLTGNVNSKGFMQSQNGGATIVPWNDFEQGGTINLIFTNLK